VAELIKKIIKPSLCIDMFLIPFLKTGYFKLTQTCRNKCIQNPSTKIAATWTRVHLSSAVCIPAIPKGGSRCMWPMSTCLIFKILPTHTPHRGQLVIGNHSWALISVTLMVSDRLKSVLIKEPDSVGRRGLCGKEQRPSNHPLGKLRSPSLGPSAILLSKSPTPHCCEWTRKWP
jgi:hypothetical protein